jgi:isopenicillin N synthase-like dioxygenase
MDQQLLPRDPASRRQEAPGARYSVPFFFHPNSDVSIEPLPTYRKADGPPLPAPIASGEYLHRCQSGAYLA